MSDPAKVKEPSMDDILSSIRQIIADEDETDVPQTAADPAPAEDAEAAADIAMEQEAELAAAEPEMAAEPEAISNDIVGDDVIGEAPEEAADEVLELSPADMVQDEEAELDAEPEIVEPEDIGFDDLEPIEESTVEEAEPEIEAEVEIEAEEPEISELEAEPEMAEMEIEEPVAEAVEAATSGIVSSDTDDVVRSALTDLSNLVMSEKTRTIEDLVQEMLRPMMKSWLDENLPNMVEELVREEIQRISRKK